MKPKALITRNLLPEAEKYLAKYVNFEIGTTSENLEKKELIEKIKDKQGLLSQLVDKVDREVIDAAPLLRVIANCAVGYDNIDVEYAGKKGIQVTNTPGVLTDTTADLAWSLILAVARKIPQADRFVRAKKFKGWKLDLFLGKEVTGKRLGIIGMGRIGKTVALRAQAFRMEVVYFDSRKLSKQEEIIHRASYISLEELLATSDIITIHATLNPQSYHLISKDRIRKMKKNAILVNVARGPIVDEKALAEALEKKLIWGAGLDVFEREPWIEEKLLALDNVVLVPHIGSATYETRLKMSLMAARNLVQALKGEKPENLVN